MPRGRKPGSGRQGSTGPTKRQEQQQELEFNERLFRSTKTAKQHAVESLQDAGRGVVVTDGGLHIFGASLEALEQYATILHHYVQSVRTAGKE